MEDSSQQLPPDWISTLSPEHHAYYYYNSITGATTWERPSLSKRSRPSTPPPPSSLSPQRLQAHLETVKEQCMDRLKERDFILEPSACGALRTAVETCDALGEDRAVTQRAVAQALSAGYSGYGDSATAAAGWIDASARGEREAAGSLGSVILRDVVRMKFKVQVLDELLVKYDAPPVWVTKLFENKVWREFFIDAASKDRVSPFLQYCIKTIAEAGFHDEVAQSIAASTHFLVFKKTLESSLMKFLAASPSVGDVYALVQICESAPYAAFYAAEILNELEQESELPKESKWVLTCVRQRIQTLEQKLLGRHDDLNEELKTTLLKIASKEIDICLADKLFLAYAGEKILPPLWPLREPEFFENLITSLFRPRRKDLTPEMRKRACSILAMAAWRKQSDEQMSEKESRLIVALEHASKVCNDPVSIDAVEEKWNADLIQPTTTHPPVALAILHWSKALLQDEDFQRSHTFSRGFLTICKIAQTSARAHPLQRPLAFAVLKLAFETKPPKDEGGAFLSDRQLATLFETVMDGFVELMVMGYVFPVLEYVSQVAHVGVDSAILRRFLIGVYNSAAPPYSLEFKSKFIALLESIPGVFVSKSNPEVFSQMKKSFLEAQVLGR